MPPRWDHWALWSLSRTSYRSASTFLIPTPRICWNSKNKDGGCVSKYSLVCFWTMGQLRTKTGSWLCFLFPHDMETNIFLMSLLCREWKVWRIANGTGRNGSGFILLHKAVDCPLLFKMTYCTLLRLHTVYTLFLTFTLLRSRSMRLISLII